MTEKIGIRNLWKRMGVFMLFSKALAEFSKQGQPPACLSEDARWLAPRLPGCSVALSLLQGRLGMSIPDTIPSANMARSFIRADASRSCGRLRIARCSQHPTIAGTIMAKTPTAKTPTAKNRYPRKSPAKAVAKAPMKKPTSAATKPAMAPAKKSTSVAKEPTLKPAAKSAPPKKQTADKTSSIAGTVLKTAKATVKQVKRSQVPCWARTRPRASGRNRRHRSLEA